MKAALVLHLFLLYVCFSMCFCFILSVMFHSCFFLSEISYIHFEEANKYFLVLSCPVLSFLVWSCRVLVISHKLKFCSWRTPVRQLRKKRATSLESNRTSQETSISLEMAFKLTFHITGKCNIGNRMTILQDSSLSCCALGEK